MPLYMETAGWWPVCGQRIPNAYKPPSRGAYATTYTSAYDVEDQPRGPYPPGYAGHLPAIRHKFGYSMPAPDVNITGMDKRTFGPSLEFASTPLPQRAFDRSVSVPQILCHKEGARASKPDLTRSFSMARSLRIDTQRSPRLASSYASAYGSPKRFLMQKPSTDVASPSGSGLGYTPNSVAMRGVEWLP
ncbi:hypothetical protein FOL47_007247 [Perkinsus chesapeaki]|uniref:Uncharacterized protein n=1 Tax=Perkinsus chesapeaki TaxID=330153 RepID=A0A7J6LLV5_PERCH|nr:hypothetical protein FOL47_007247 [Perkinsus chesapeaki]